ncbi:hypothetical protein DLH72_01240 [Candidatus Gracilibacteria bacterium]|nr:MAG: hypothetical protein DLH72_01240 [Candidatus Gracilibacteria bacterium]
MIDTKKGIIAHLSSPEIGENEIFELTRKTKKSLRTIAQNKYYFGVVVKHIADFIGLAHKFEKLEIHNQIKEYFNLETTTDLEVGEFKAMIEEIRAWYLEHRGLYIPLPRECEDLADLEKYLF